MRAIRASHSALFAAVLLCAQPASARTEESDPDYRRHYVGSSLFMLMNLVPLSQPPSFYQLNYGYRVTPNDVLSVEAITWRYQAPIGIPWGSSHGAPEEEFPGSVRAYGVGVVYQRFLWNGLYAAVHALPMHQTYYGTAGEELGTGFQLFLTLRVGYHLELFSNRFFLEPSVACTYWPINTNLPDSFQKMENKWPNYFLLEPGLHFGVKF